MGGKTSTSTSQVSIPPEVLARYNSVNATAEQTAQQPFQQYSTDPSAFVAPLTPTQYAGIGNTNAAAGMAQPYFQAGTGFALAGAQPVNAQPLDISRYMNPYLGTVLGSTEALVNQQNQQAMSGQTGNAMSQGYFGGDRSGIASAVLQGQQMLQGGQLYSGIASDAFNQAMAAAQQQQGVGLGAGQANRAAIQQAAEMLAGLGTGAQGAALQGAQAQLGAGQMEQQTAQAGKTALYNQFLQQESYPFQVAQFLANIAEGTGALSGNTTTTTQPGGLFSDERLKEDMEPIGKGFDGANIYRFRYRGDPTTRIGMSAQEVEQRHPEAVSEHGGFKAVDYGAATDDAAGFGRAANDNTWDEPRRARQAGGMSGWGMYPPGINPMSIGELLQAQEQMYGPGFGGAGLYGGSPSGMPHGGSSYVPAPMGGSPTMIHGTPPPTRPQTTALDALHSAAGLSGDVKGLEDDAKMAGGAWDDVQNWWDLRHTTPGGGPGSAQGSQVPYASGGFARTGRADGGGFDPSDPENDSPYGAKGGPGLNIPTAPEQHQQLQGTAPPKQGPSGASQLLGAGADIATIAKAAPEIGSLASGIGSGLAGAAGAIGSGIGAAGSGIASLLPFLMLANRGGRVPRADGGGADDLYKPKDSLDIPDDTTRVTPLQPEQPQKQGSGDQTMTDIMDIAKIAAMFAGAKRGGRIGYAGGGGSLDAIRTDLEGSDNDPLMDELLRGALSPHTDAAPGPASTPPAAPGSPTGGAGPAAPPPAGFAGAKPPGAPAAAAEAGFAGAKPGGSLGHIYGLEGTGKNPSSSAIGVGQLLDSTYMGLLRRAHPDIAAQVGNDKAAIQAFRRTPKGLALSAELAPMNQADNRAVMEHHGIPVTPTNEHVMWVLGPGDGPKVLKADPSTPLKGLISDAAIAANPRIMGGGKTAGDFVTWARHGMASGGFAGARHGYQTDGLVVDPGAGDPDDPRHQVSQVDPAMIEQAKRAAQDPAVVAQAAQNREAAAQGAPAPPAAQAAVTAPAPQAAGDGDIMPGVPLHGEGFLPADQSGGAGAPSAQRGGIDLDEDARENRMGRQFYAQEIARQRGPQGGGIMGMLQRNWIPIMQGIAAGASAPTSHPLTALLVGGGAFANAEQAQRQYQLGQAKTLAELEQTGENVDTGAYSGVSGRISSLGPYLSAAIAPGGTVDQWFPDAHQVANGERQFWDMRPGHLPNAKIGESQVNQIKQHIAQAGVAALQRGDVSGLMNTTYGVMGQTPAGSAPAGDASDRPTPGHAAGDGAGAGNTGSGGGGGNAADGRTPGGAPHPGGGPPPVGGSPPADQAHPAAPGTQVPAPTAPVAGQPPKGGWGASVEDRLKSGYYSQQPFQAALPDESQLDHMSSPTWLRDQAAQLRQHGDASTAADYEALANKIQTGDKDTPVLDKNQHQIPNPFIAYNQGRTKQDQLTASNTKLHTTYLAGADAFRTTGGQMQALLDMDAQVSRDTSMNTLTPELRTAVGMLRSIPGMDSILSPQLKVWDSNVAEAEKVQAARQMLSVGMQHLQHAPGTALPVAGHATPGAGSPGGARYANDIYTQAVLLRDKAWYDDVAAHGDTITRWDRYSPDWQAANPMSKYMKMAADRLGGFYAGMQPQEMWKYPRHPQSVDELNALPKGTPVMWPPGAQAKERWT